MSSESKYTHRVDEDGGAIYKYEKFLCFGGSIAAKELNELHAALEEHHGNLLGVTADRDGWRTAAEKNADTELASLREDKARLDWMESDNCYWIEVSSEPHGGTVYKNHPELQSFRGAIDAARKAAK